MATLFATGTVLVASVFAPAAPNHNSRPGCRKTFDAAMIHKAITAVYRGRRDVTARDRAHLRRYVRCSRPVTIRPAMHRYWNNVWRAWKLRRNPPMNGPVVASWFWDAGATACGIHATYGFATLMAIPCGARILMRGPSGRVIDAVREDSGPYVGGRTFDVNPALRDALGCGGLCQVYWR